MKINDLEKLLGVKRSNIFYYEREGLVTPRREDNNYREYSEEDLRRLKAVLVLRKLGFTVEEIKSLLAGERDLADLLPENLRRLEQQTEALTAAADLCRRMQREGLTIDSLDPDEWFETVESEERQGKRFLDLVDDMADNVTRTIAFVQDSIGFVGPAYAEYFLSPEGIEKRRLWKLYWALLALDYLAGLLSPYLLPGHYLSLADPWAALVFTLLRGVVGSLVLWCCARYVIPGRTPRQALWLTVALIVGVNLVLSVAGRQAARLETDETARTAWQESLGQGPYTGNDPAGYVQSLNDRWYGGRAELDRYETDGYMCVFTSWGAVFSFRQNAEDQWVEQALGSVVVDGNLYTPDPYGPRQYPSRLLLTDGTTAEPIYEASLSTGYIPLYAFDVSAGQEYTGIEYGVDGDGGLHYELDRAEYRATADWSATPFYNEKRPMVTLRQLLAADGGPEFLAAFRSWRDQVQAETEPFRVTERAMMGAEGSYVLWAEYFAPPVLAVRPADAVRADWGLNGFSDQLYYHEDGPATLHWIMTCEADILPLLQAETVTPDLLLQAARTAAPNELDKTELIQDANSFLDGSYLAYSEMRAWYVTVPEELAALGSRCFSALNGHND